MNYSIEAVAINTQQLFDFFVQHMSKSQKSQNFRSFTTYAAGEAEPQSGEAKPQFTGRFRKGFPFVKSSCDGTVSENLAAKHKNMQRAEES